MPVREALYRRRQNLWREILYDTRGAARESVVQQRLAKLEEWRADPWAYLTGRDVADMEQCKCPKPDLEHDYDCPGIGRPIFWTADEFDEDAPVKSFPALKPYLKEITRELWAYRFVFIDKVRQRYISTLCCLNIDWFCSFKEEREVFVSKKKEGLAIKLISDKIRSPHARKPEWLRAACPIGKGPQEVITFSETRSTVTAVSENFAVGDARGATASLVLVDEAAFQDFFPEMYRAIVPMASRLWAVTTANIGNPGAALFKKLIDEGVQG